MAVQVKIGCRVDARAAKRLARVLSATDKINRRIGLHVQSNARMRLRERAGVMTPAGWPSHSKGGLAKTIQVRQEPNATIIATDAVHAAIQQYGGTVKPVNVTRLAIPVTKKARKQGPKDFPGILELVPLRNPKGNITSLLVEVASTAKQIRAKKARAKLSKEVRKMKLAVEQSANAPPGTRKAVEMHGRLIVRELRLAKEKAIAAAAREGAQGVTQYLLAEQVTIPAQPYLKWGPEEESFAREEYARALKVNA